MGTGSPIGINGIGRIGKLLVWIFCSKKYHDEIVISTGREVGKGLPDLASYLEFDSTYHEFQKFFFGYDAGKKIEIRDGHVYVNGVKITWLSDTDCRLPGKIPWSEHGVDVVFETTGTYADPTVNDEKSLRGHLNHAKKVILTAPFKIKNKTALSPEDAITLVGGVNFHKYDPMRHAVISNASCTTNCCAPPIKALVDHFGEKMISYSITTVHASTNSQSVLDTLPKKGEKDTRKTRSLFNNLIPTSTGAASAVLEVIPEIRELGIGSQASSIRVPTTTGSIVIMDVNIIGEYDNLYMHDIFRKYAGKNPKILLFSEMQLVSCDIIGSVYSSIYDSHFTHHRTSKRGNEYYTMFDLNFWYDNEFGYINSLVRLYEHITGKKN